MSTHFFCRHKNKDVPLQLLGKKGVAGVIRRLWLPTFARYAAEGSFSNSLSRSMKRIFKRLSKKPLN